MPEYFVIVGAQRCGTTYLYRLLDEHPEIEMAKPIRPEPKFFLDDAECRRGIAYYASQFFSDPKAHVRGEKSTSYLESPTALARINATLPDATIVAVLRDPVHRAISNYRFSLQHGVEHLPAVEALDPSAQQREWDPAQFSVSPFDYLARGRYVEYLEALVRSMGSDRLHVLIFEDLVADAGVVARLYERLGVDASFRALGAGTPVNASEGGGESVPPAIVDQLRDYFREPNERLAGFLGRALPWP